jgi:hypothetical protein
MVQFRFNEFPEFDVDHAPHLHPYARAFRPISEVIPKE